MQKLLIRTGFMYKIMHESCFYGIIKKTMWIGYQMEVPMTEREKMLAGELYDCGDADERER